MLPGRPGRAGILQCGRSLCSQCLFQPPVPRHCSACSQARWGSPGQLLCRAREGLMPPSFPRKAPTSGVSLPLAAADMAGLLVTSAQPPPGRDLPGLWSSPAVLPCCPAASHLPHACPGPPGPRLEALSSPRWAGGGRAEGLPEAWHEFGFSCGRAGGLAAGQEGPAAGQERPVAQAAAQGFGGSDERV